MDYCHHSFEGENPQEICLSQVPIFNHMTHQEMTEIAHLFVSKTHQKGEVIFLSGQLSENLYIIRKGRVKISRVSESGKEQILRILGPGDFMGESSLFGYSSLNSNAEALVSTKVCMIHRNNMQKLVMKFPNISVKILEEFSKILEGAESLIEQLGLQDVEQRVARILLQLADHEENEGKQELDLTLSMSKRDLASLIGTTQETLSRKLSVFQERGWIKQIGQRRILVLDRSDLRRLASL